ncbi:CASP-like protein [Acorus gramineus]|uniref:CASP-like protein n=1 Tax=Acorus gramineus TaxID=55184 RepID=A0AAV8ZZN1_ACOGR|nr:CASP-like protein [Acorus gramineus]
MASSSSTGWKIAVLVLRLFTLLFLIASLVLLATNTLTGAANTLTGDGGGKVRSKDFYAYRYVLAVEAIGSVYTLVQIPFAVLSIGKKFSKEKVLTTFNLVSDKIFALLFATGVGAGFGLTVEIKRVLNALERGGGGDSNSFGAVNKFFNKVQVSTGLLLLATLCMAALSIGTSIVIYKK